MCGVVFDDTCDSGDDDMKEIVVYMENELVEKKCKNVLMKVPKCWKLVIEETLGWPHFVKLANDME